MPYIPFVPVPPVIVPQGAWTGATTGATTQIDYNLTLDALGVQLSQIGLYLSGGPGGVAAKEPGSMLYIMANSAQSLAGINDALQTLVLGNNKQVGAQLSGANSVQSSLTTIAGLLSTMIAMQQLSLSDQIKHNEFQVQATNTARKEQDPNKPPIDVPGDTLTARIQDGVNNIGTINSTTKVAGLATNLAGDALSHGADIAKNLVSSTAVGQTIIGYGTQVKSYIATQVADIEASAKAASISAKTNKATLPAVGGGKG